MLKAIRPFAPSWVEFDGKAMWAVDAHVHLVSKAAAPPHILQPRVWWVTPLSEFLPRVPQFGDILFSSPGSHSADNSPVLGPVTS